MAQTINTNVASLNAQRNLTSSQGSLATSLQRLSSGLRINSAKDDAAGLAISERFSTQIRGLNQATRNANDGISLSQTAESALVEVSNNLQRIRELAVQSANSTNSSSDRQALNAEVQQRIEEINRVASQTAFNGLKVLDGSFGNSAFQVGANAGETISMNLSQGVKTNQIGQIAYREGGAVTAAVPGTMGISLGGGSAIQITAPTDGLKDGQEADSAYAKAEAIKSAGIAGLEVSAKTVSEPVTFDAIDLGTAADTEQYASYKLEINGVTVLDVGGETVNGTPTLDNRSVTVNDVVTAINRESSRTGVTAALNDDGDLVMTAEDGRNINVTDTLTAGDQGDETGTGLDSATNFAAPVRGKITLSSSESIEFSDLAEAAKYGFSGNITKDTTTLNSVSVDSVDAANDAMRRVDAALTTVNSIRADLGAVQNRFESVISNLQASSENLAASRGRIVDADFATETANLTRSQILQQAGTAMLAQANGLPQNVLSLLRG